MKNFIIKALVIFLICVSSAQSQSGWVNQSGGTSVNLFSVCFINDQTGWISGDSGVILNTTDSGVNWVRQNSGTTYPLLNIMFADDNTIWASGGYDDNNPLCSHYYVLLKSTNGGVNWVTITVGVDGFYYNDMSVINENTIYTTTAGICCPPFCVVSAGSVSKTTNSGLTWNSGLGDAYYSVFFLNENTGWAAGQSSSDVLAPKDYIYKTTNAGSNWDRILFDTAFNYNPYRKIMFTGENTGYAIKGKLLKSTDSGVDWSNTDSIITANVTDLYFINADTGWCTGFNGILIRTNDGGQTWTNQSASTLQKLNSVYFNDAYYGWAVGNNGTIIKTITGGLTSVTQIQSNEIPDHYSLSQNYPNPFNPSTNLEFGISDLGFVSLKIYDALGNEIETLVNENLSPGSYQVKWNGQGLASGIYFYRLTADGKHIGTKRMILVK
ncbi:MAG TPA: YCF48-related protein [Ignavibacteria bacterium]|nr:YCF48-related protein [Ignavibacteria bacterium]